MMFSFTTRQAHYSRVGYSCLSIAVPEAQPPWSPFTNNAMPLFLISFLFLTKLAAVNQIYSAPAASGVHHLSHSVLGRELAQTSEAQISTLVLQKFILISKEISFIIDFIFTFLII